MSLVERELFRAALYAHLLRNVGEILTRFKRVGDKEVSQLVLRYIFNKIPARKDEGEDDPVFITTPAPAAATQVERDLQHLGITPSQLSSRDLVQVIEYRFARAAAAMRSTTFKADEPVVLETAASIPLLRYKGITYTDYAQLGKRHPDQLHHVLALGIRYTYLQLVNQGLACDYARDGYVAGAAVEAFASTFNHFFDTYYSAFPDLDPPFDETVMERAVEQVLAMLAATTASTRLLRARVILPAWKDLAALTRLTASPLVTSCVLHKKGTFAFVNHMLPRASATARPKQIFPCDLYEIWLASSLPQPQDA
jgi:hypothetical protein